MTGTKIANVDPAVYPWFANVTLTLEFPLVVVNKGTAPLGAAKVPATVKGPKLFVPVEKVNVPAADVSTVQEAL